MTEPAQAPAGWYPEWNSGWLRYWDGSAWTDHRTSAQTAPGVAAVPSPQLPAVSAPVVAPPVVGLVHNGATWTAGGTPLSSSGRRLGAYLLDGLLVFVTLIVGWLIWSLILWSQGQSPAKSLLGMRCVRPDTGRVATWGTMALREVVGKMLLGSITYGITTIISCFMILGASQQGIWDRIASTVVVDDPDRRLRR